MNWTQIIEDITKRGYTMANVARLIGVEPVTIQALRHGRSANPQWPTGDALIRLHKKVMRKYPKVDTVA